MNESPVDLSGYSAGKFDRGRPAWMEWTWRIVSAVFFQNPCFPFYAPKRALLRLFGARVGRGVLVKPRVTITFPWRIRIGECAWIGEGVWLDSLAEIAIGGHACISQGAYVCTGYHDIRSPKFGLRAEPVTIGEGAWLAARCVVSPAVVVGAGAILALGSVATSDLAPMGIYRGNPAVRVGTREIRGA